MITPAQLTKAELVAVVSDIFQGVQSGDTLEGSLSFQVADDPELWDVTANYRIGNTMGQGGMRIIGTVVTA